MMRSEDEMYSGFRMPPEWHPHERCWMAWPCRASMWGDAIERVRDNYCLVAEAIAGFEPVTMVAHPRDAEDARRRLGNGIEVVAMPIDDSWTRDSGPCFLLDAAGRVAGASFRFTAWGGKHHPYDQDALLSQRVLERLGMEERVTELVGEGGAVSVDGEGTILTTESCLLNVNRNPGWSKREVEAELCRLLGGSKVIWLPGDVDEKETDGHVDGLAAFVRPGLVLLETAFDSAHPRYAMLRENYRALVGQTDARGRELDIVFIEDAWECALGETDACVSYINSYLANGGVVMPRYGIAADERARRVYQRLYPQRRIVQVAVDDIAPGGGGIHCITQQQPSGSRFV